MTEPTGAPSPATDPNGRLADLGYDALDEDQRAVWRAVTEGRRGAASELVNERGGLVGPFNAMLRSPAIGRPLTALGEALRFDSSLEPSLREVAILTAGAHWRSEFEFWAHGRIAREVGLATEVIEGIADGRVPDDAPEAARLVHRLAHLLLTEGQVDDASYRDAVRVLGEPAVVEVVALVGYYCLISFVLNTFRVPLPEGVRPRWA